MKRLLLLFLIPVSLLGQVAVRIDQPLLATGPNVPMPGGALPQAIFLANATVAVCVHPATLASCTPALTFNDSNEDAACPSATPLVQLPGTTCTASVGTGANVGFWYSGGTVDYIVNSQFGSLGPFIVTGGNASASGTVTSLSVNTTAAAPLFTCTVSTPTTTPAIVCALTNAAQNAFWAGPSSGGTGAPSYRAIVPADVPTLDQNTTGTAANVTGIVAAANGGTNSSTAPSSGQILVAQSSTTYAPKTMSGSCTLASSGAITCTSGSLIPNPNTPTFTKASACSGGTISLQSGSNDFGGSLVVTVGCNAGAIGTLAFGGTYSTPVWCGFSTGNPAADTFQLYTNTPNSANFVLSTNNAFPSGSFITYSCHL